MKKLFMAILAIIPMGMFAQEIRYVTVPTSQDVTPAPTYTTTTTTQTYQAPVLTTKALVRSNELFRDTLKTSAKRAIHTTFLKNNFWDNWYLSVGGGFGVLMSEESRYAGYWNIKQPTVAFSVGKWFTPVIGARLSATASRLQGFSIWHSETSNPDLYDQHGSSGHWGYGNYYVGKNYHDPLETLLNRYTTNTYLDAQSGNWLPEPNASRAVGEFIEDTFLDMNRPYHAKEGDGYLYSLTYAAASADFLVDVTTLFDKYRPNRFFHLNAFAGVGYSHTFKENRWIADPDGTKPGEHNDAGQVNRSKTAVNTIMAKAGLEMTFRLSKQMSLNLEGNMLILPEYFDRKVGDGNTMDGVANVLVGLSYKFNERFFYEPLCSSNTPQFIPAIINEARSSCCEDIAASLKRIEEILSRQQAPPAPAPGLGRTPSEIAKELEHLKIAVYFIIDKWEVRQSEMYKLDEIAKFMAKYPRVRVSVSGYADVQTAYPAYNLKLSERRANEVTRILTTKYGIDRSRLRVEHYGDTVQPFDVNELNRAVIAFDIPED